MEDIRFLTEININIFFAYFLIFVQKFVTYTSQAIFVISASEMNVLYYGERFYTKSYVHLFLHGWLFLQQRFHWSIFSFLLQWFSFLFSCNQATVRVQFPARLLSIQLKFHILNFPTYEQAKDYRFVSVSRNVANKACSLTCFHPRRSSERKFRIRWSYRSPLFVSVNVTTCILVYSLFFMHQHISFHQICSVSSAG